MGLFGETQFKRKFPRRKFLRAVGFLYNGDYFVGQGEEVGEGGIALSLPQEFPVGREAVVSFQIPEGSFVSLRVEVRNLQKTPSGQVLVGCAFKNLKSEFKRQIRVYISSRRELEN